MPQTSVNTLVDRIESMLDESLPVGDELAVESLERTLTDGYAEALRLDSDRMRIERRIDQVVLSRTSAEAKAEELNSLILRLGEAGEELERLRALLASLKARARAARAAAA